MVETRKIPTAACRFAADVEIGDNGEDAKTAPIKLVARTGDPVVSPWFDMPIIHDFAGMKAKPRIAIDWMHNDDVALGFLNRIDASNGDLVCSGALIQINPDDQTGKILKQSRLGVPFESSIDWRGNAVIEELGGGMQATVNGRTIFGPAIIVREWMLRGVALCLHGMDPNTSAEFTDGDTTTVLLLKNTLDTQTPNGDEKMSQENTVVEGDKPVETPVEDKAETEAKVVEASVEAQEVVVEAQTAEGKEKPVEVVEQTDVPKEAATQSEGERFLQTFGDSLGGKWFAQGKTFEEATQLFIKHLSQENAELKQRMQASRGADAPVSFSESNISDAQRELSEAADKNMATGVSPAVAQWAAATQLHYKNKKAK